MSIFLFFYKTLQKKKKIKWIKKIKKTVTGNL